MASAYQEKVDIGRVLQRGFSAIGHNFASFLVLSLLFSGIPTFLQQYVLLGQMSGREIPGTTAFLPAYLGLYFLTFFGSYLLQAAVVRAVLQDLDGRPADLADSILSALRFLFPMIGLSIVAGLGIVLGLLLLVVPGIILFLMWSVAVPVLVEERAGVIGSLHRSAELTSGSKWRILGLYVITFILSSMLGGIMGASGMMLSEVSPVMFAGLSAVAAMLGGLLSAAMFSALYVELRTVKEGSFTDSLVAVFD